jgi:hypothetical protein
MDFSDSRPKQATSRDAAGRDILHLQDIFRIRPKYMNLLPRAAQRTLTYVPDAVQHAMQGEPHKKERLS